MPLPCRQPKKQCLSTGLESVLCPYNPLQQHIMHVILSVRSCLQSGLAWGCASGATPSQLGASCIANLQIALWPSKFAGPVLHPLPVCCGNTMLCYTRVVAMPRQLSLYYHCIPLCGAILLGGYKRLLRQFALYDSPNRSLHSLCGQETVFEGKTG